MNNQSSNAQKTSRRRFAKATLAALGVLAGVPSSSGQQRKPKQKTLKRQEIKQTSPITIGGGSSVSIDFKHRHYTGKEGKYSHATDEILTAQIFDSFNSLKWELASLVQGIDCTVTVHTTKKNGTDNKDIIIRSRPNGPFSVEFDEREFPLKAGQRNFHYQEDRKISGVIEVLDNDSKLQATFAPPTSGICSIHLLNSRD